MAAKVTRPCQRNDCPAPARAGVELSSTDQVAVLVDLPADRDPRRMELCSDHAASMTVPMGWTRDDQRAPDEVDAPTGPPTLAEIASLSTLDVITAALGPTVPGDHAEATHEPAPADDGPSVAAVMAAALANPEGSEPRDEPAPVDEPGVESGVESEVEVVAPEAAPSQDADDEQDVTAGAQLTLAPDQPPARRARPVPAALDGDSQEPAPLEDQA